MFNLTAPLGGGTLIAAVLAALLFGAIGLRCVLGPDGGARFFGVAVQDGPGRSFVQAMGARNLGLSLTALGLILFGARAGLAALIFAAVVTAALDAAIVWRASGVAKAAKHLAYAPAFLVFGLWIASGR